MDKKNKFLNGFMLGFAIGTIIWVLSYSYIIGHLDKIHQQELNYIIDKHLTQPH